jgi:hypothetical protein
MQKKLGESDIIEGINLRNLFNEIQNFGKINNPFQNQGNGNGIQQRGQENPPNNIFSPEANISTRESTDRQMQPNPEWRTPKEETKNPKQFATEMVPPKKAVHATKQISHTEIVPQKNKYQYKKHSRETYKVKKHQYLP